MPLHRQKLKSSSDAVQGDVLRFLVLVLAAIGLSLFLMPSSVQRTFIPNSNTTIPPLVMQGGDPYIRALMRTISVSEANDPLPYGLLYGGTHTDNLSSHPDRCILITSGPNTGNCTTAAGRYQFITTTWLEKAENYHPHPSRFLLWKSYSFEPEFQDTVVYRWLNDPQAWGVDLSQLLRAGKINEVLKTLSGTWTSLGYGIEDNSMTSVLPQAYQKVLQDELKQHKAKKLS